MLFKSHQPTLTETASELSAEGPPGESTFFDSLTANLSAAEPGESFHYVKERLRKNGKG